jgi:hypothetical protein
MVVSPDPNLAPEPTLHPRRHRLPLISILLASVFPVYFLVVVCSRGLVLKVPFAVVLPALSVSAILATLVTGHRALVHTRRDPTAQTGQRLAITTLVLGYLSLAFVVLVVCLLFSAALEDE